MAKIAVAQKFSCPCVLMSTLFVPIFSTMVDGSIFKYNSVLSIFAIEFSSKLYLLLSII